MKHRSSGRRQHASASHVQVPEKAQSRFNHKMLASTAGIVLSASILASGTTYAADEAAATETKPESSATVQSNENAAAAPASSKTAAAEPEESSLGAVVVTSRNREEIAQDVPLPISVLGSKQIERDRIQTIEDLTKKAPGMTATTPNARRTGISIRGLGKASGNDNMEAAVGVIVDGVFLSHVGMSYQDFTDLDRVEVLRGPQGTLLGKNTTLGAINYVSKAPRFTPEGLFELELGHPNHSEGLEGAFKAKGSYTNSLIDNVLAYRGSFFIDKQDGDIVNINPNSGDRFHEKNRWGGRLQFLLQPSDKLTAKINIDGARAYEYSNTKPFMVDPTTFADGSARTTTYTTRLARDYFGGYRPIIGSWDKIDINQAKPLITDNYGISGTVDWDLGPVTLTSITAYRGLKFDANNDGEQTKFDINRGGTLVYTKQYSQEFRLTSTPGGIIDYQTGLFYMHNETDSLSRTLYGQDAGAFYASNSQYTTLNTPANRAFLKAALNNVLLTTRTTPQTDSVAAFGQINWHLTDKATLTLGLRETYEEKSSDIEKLATFADGSALTSTGNATANAVRNAQLGTVYGLKKGEDINESSLSWLASPSYKLTKDVLLYASAAAGQKSSSVQFKSSDGTPQNVDPEKSLDFELGFKSLVANRKVMLNVNLYQTTVKDYQATTSVVDSTSATGFSSRLGNIPEIRARGVEVDGAWSATSNLNFNFGGAYNHAVYTDWKTATCPAEIPTTVQAVCDNTGKQIVGAPRWTGIFGVDYRVPLAGDLTGHFFLNNVVRSKQNLEAQLSEFGQQAGYSLTDGGLGVISAKYKTELNLVAKNLFDTKYTTSVNNFSNSAPVGFDGIGARRYIGVVLRSNF